MMHKAIYNRYFIETQGFSKVAFMQSLCMLLFNAVFCALCLAAGKAQSAKNFPVAAGDWAHKNMLSRSKEGANRENQVEGAEKQSLEPGRFAIQADQRVEARCQGE